MTTFHTRRGSSNIDLTIINNLLVPTLSEWEISDEETCSDHNLITYSIGQGHCNSKKDNFHGRRYVVKEEYFDKFDNILNNRISIEFEQHHLEGETESLDKLLSDKILEETDVETTVEKFQKALNTACENTFNKKRLTIVAPGKRTVP